MRDALRALVEQWRKSADEFEQDGDWCCAVMRRHDADDLEALLSVPLVSAQVPQETKDDDLTRVDRQPSPESALPRPPTEAISASVENAGTGPPAWAWQREAVLYIADTERREPAERDKADPRFEVLWDLLKQFDVDFGDGTRSGVTGNDICAVLDRLDKEPMADNAVPNPPAEPASPQRASNASVLSTSSSGLSAQAGAPSYDEKLLPSWAQEALNTRAADIDRLTAERDGARMVARQMQDRVEQLQAGAPSGWQPSEIEIVLGEVECFLRDLDCDQSGSARELADRVASIRAAPPLAPTQETTK